MLPQRSCEFSAFRELDMVNSFEKRGPTLRLPATAAGNSGREPPLTGKSSRAMRPLLIEPASPVASLRPAEMSPKATLRQVRAARSELSQTRPRRSGTHIVFIPIGPGAPGNRDFASGRHRDSIFSLRPSVCFYFFLFTFDSSLARLRYHGKAFRFRLCLVPPWPERPARIRPAPAPFISSLYSGLNQTVPE